MSVPMESLRDLPRLPDWQDRLVVLLAEAATQRFGYGRQDCALFAGRAVEAILGVSLTEGIAGAYADLTGGLQLLAAMGMADHVDLAAQLLDEIDARQARPGDLAAVFRGAPHLSLGVVHEAGVYVLADGPLARGWIVVPRTDVARVFRVGLAHA